MNANISRVILGAIALASAFPCLLPAAPVRAPAPAKKISSAYVDPQACAGCHQDIARSFHQTGMGRSVYRPTVANVIEDYQARNTVYNKASGLYYTMLERDGKFYQRRYQIGFDGKETNVIEVQVDYVIGSGNHARTYLHRTADGKLIELPVSWYTEKSGYWAMSPGYDRPDQDDFRRAIPAECMFCHNAYPPPSEAPKLNNSEIPVFGEHLPQGIDCQRCHGPGSAHIAATSSSAPTLEKIRHAIVNPARLSRDRQLEVCMQCHLETSSRHVPNEIRRYDRDIDSYRPGEPLGDYKLYFDQAPGKNDDRFEIAHAAYRLRKSACFQSSQMTCTTCHDPHQEYRGATTMQHYIAVCQSCHQSVVHAAALPAGSNCVGCHMPKRRTDDAVHVVMTDHYIQRRPPTRDLLAPFAEQASEAKNPGGIALYYPPQISHAPENELDLAVAQVEDGTNLQAAITRLQDSIRKYAPAQAGFYLELARGYAKAGKNNEAIHWFEEALRRRPNDRAALEDLVVALFATGRIQRATEMLQQAVAIPPADEMLFVNLGNAYLRQRMLAQAQRALERALELNPNLSQAHNLLGLVAVQSRRPVEAEADFRDAIRSQPDLSEAHNNLANLLTGAGNYPEAKYHFEKALAISPGYADAHHSYGLLLAIMRQYDQAIAELEQAIRLAPKEAQTHDDLADILAARGELAPAANEYRQAIQFNPELPDAHYSLASILALQGKNEEAEREFRISLQLNANAPEAHLGLGQTLLREGKTAEARMQLEKAAESPDPAIRGAAQSVLGHLPR